MISKLLTSGYCLTERWSKGGAVKLKKITWIDRSLIQVPGHIALCISEDEYEKWLKRLKIPPKDRDGFVNIGANATTHFFENTETNQLCIIICFKVKKGIDRIEEYALLVHEAVHAWQEIKKSIGETTPSDEFEAYAIQSISARLMDAYDKMRRVIK